MPKFIFSLGVEGECIEGLIVIPTERGEEGFESKTGDGGPELE